MNRREALRRIGTGMTGLGIVGSGRAQSGAILTRRIPSSDKVIPVIGLGTWQTFDVASSAQARAPRAQVLSAFAELGGRVIDSSPMYGNSASVVGDLIAKLGLRSKLFIAT